MPEVIARIDIPAETARHAPMPRRRVSPREWEQAAGDAARGSLTLVSLWAHRSSVMMALREPEEGRVGILALENRRRDFPSVCRLHAPAQRLERAIGDLHGLMPKDAPDTRPWLDHGKWPAGAPLARKPAEPQARDYAFLPVEGESLHQVPVGPVHAGIIEPGHFRFTAQGETVVRLEERLGYVHKGIDRLMQGVRPDRGAEIAARTSGDSTVAYSWAFAQAVEAASGAKVPQRALFLRAIMAELERLANHLGDFGAICNDAAFAMMLAQCSVLRERVLRTSAHAFGNRFMKDIIVPGGVARDLDADGIAGLRDLISGVGHRLEELVDLYDNTASLLDRTVRTGILGKALAERFGAGGFVGRASGRDFDLRRDFAYAPYDRYPPHVAVRDAGDVNARIWVRIDEMRESMRLIGSLLTDLPGGPIRDALPVAGEPREGVGWVEGFRGDIFVWLAMDARGTIERCHMRDPSWFQWPLLEAAIEGNIIADFPLCNKSFNCSYSGHDL